MKLARERLEAMRQTSLHVAAVAASTKAAPIEEIQASVPMGRQISLKDLFGQQRAQDDAWSVRAHHLVPEQQHPQQPNYQHMMPHQMPSPTPPPQPQSDVLGDLFRRAGLAQQGNGQGH